jgi:hypothetical protein
MIPDIDYVVQEYMREITLKKYVEQAKILKDKREKKAPTQ